MEWISIKDEKPPMIDEEGSACTFLQSENVLVTNGKECQIACLILNRDGSMLWLDHIKYEKEYHNVTHWCWLPELPLLEKKKCCKCGKTWTGGDYIDCGWCEDGDRIYCCKCKTK